MNETHKLNGRCTLPSANHVKFEEESCYFMKESDIKWCIKSATDNGCLKQLSSPSSTEYSKKENNKVVLKSSLIPNGRLQSPSSGFDIKKLYPELSSKLGLISSSPEKANKITSAKKLNKIKLINSLDNNQSDSKFSNMCCENETKEQSTHNELRHASVSIGISFGKEETLTNSSSIFKLNERKHSQIKNKKSGIKVKSKNNLLSHKAKLLSFENRNLKYLPSTLQYQSKSEKLLKPNEIGHNKPSFEHESHNNVHSLGEKTKSPAVLKLYPSCNTFPHSPKVCMLPSLRVNKANKNKYAYKTNLFPLGFESSEYDTSDDDSTVSYLLPEYHNKHNNHNDLKSNDSQKSKLFSEFYRQQILCKKTRLEIQEINLRRSLSFMKAKINASKCTNVNTSSECFNEDDATSPIFERKMSENCRPLKSKLCVYTGGEEKMCIRKALPGTRHCLRHITYNVDQQLFSQCSAKKNDNTICRTPTFDVLHDPPLCQEHGSDVYLRSSPLENSEKLKKPKKKSKMPILSRGKRYKKRRHSFESSIIPSTRVRPPINSPGNCFGSVEPPSPLASSNLFSPCSDDNEDTEFETDFKEIEEDIPLEAASHLLESKDFQDVLNKLPDPDLSQIFYATDNRQLPGVEEEDQKVKILPPSGRISRLPKENEPNISLVEPTITDMNNSKVIDSFISFNQHELNAISQVLSSMVNDHTLNLDSFAHVDDVVGKEVSSSPPILEVSTSSGNFSEDSNSESSKSQAMREPISPPQECNNVHCAPMLQATNLKISPPTLQPL